MSEGVAQAAVLAALGVLYALGWWLPHIWRKK